MQFRKRSRSGNGWLCKQALKVIEYFSFLLIFLSCFPGPYKAVTNNQLLPTSQEQTAASEYRVNKADQTYFIMADQTAQTSIPTFKLVLVGDGGTGKVRHIPRQMY